jgi:hypothetical protein
VNSLWKAEPTMILAVVSAGIALAIGFGAPITTQQMGLIMAFVAAVLGLINRSQVTSAATLQNMTPKTLADAQDTAQPVKDVVKKLPAVLLACILAGSAFGCASAPPNLSPAAHVAFVNTRAIKGLDILRDFAIDANNQQPPIISTATTRKVVLYHESSVKIIDASGSGWRAAVLTGLDELVKEIPANESPKLTPYVILLKTILTEIP